MLVANFDDIASENIENTEFGIRYAEVSCATPRAKFVFLVSNRGNTYAL